MIQPALSAAGSAECSQPIPGCTERSQLLLLQLGGASAAPARTCAPQHSVSPTAGSEWASSWPGVRAGIGNDVFCQWLKILRGNVLQKKKTKKQKQTTKKQVHLNLFELWISNVKCWVCLPLLMLVAKGINSQELVRSLPSPFLYLKGYSIKGHKNLVLAGSWTVTGMGWSSSAIGLPSLFSNLKSWQIVFQWRNLLETRQLLQDQIPSGRANTWCGWAAWGIQKGICFLHWLMEWHCFFSCFCWAFLYDWQFPFLMPQAYKTTKSCLGPHIFNHILCICSFLNGKESLNISLLAPPLVVEVQ